MLRETQLIHLELSFLHIGREENMISEEIREDVRSGRVRKALGGCPSMGVRG